MMVDYDEKQVPKSACYSLVQIISAAVLASNTIAAPLSIAEATQAIDNAYPMKDRQQEMLYDGSYEGLAEPFSRKRAPSKGVHLENEMIETVHDLYDLEG